MSAGMETLVVLEFVIPEIRIFYSTFKIEEVGVGT
jgi:hypothetical protein